MDGASFSCRTRLGERLAAEGEEALEVGLGKAVERHFVGLPVAFQGEVAVPKNVRVGARLNAVALGDGTEMSVTPLLELLELPTLGLSTRPLSRCRVDDGEVLLYALYDGVEFFGGELGRKTAKSPRPMLADEID